MVRPSAIVTRFLAPLAASRKSTGRVYETSAPRARMRNASFAPASAEQALEEVLQFLLAAEALARVVAACGGVLGEVAIVILRPLLAAGVDLAAIVAPAPFGIGQDVVGGGHLLEALADLRLVRVQVGMHLLGELAVGALDVVLAGVPGDAERGIEIVAHGRSRMGPLICMTW